MTILGLDVGFATLGWARVEVVGANAVRLQGLGLVTTAPGEAHRLKSEDNVARARALTRCLRLLICGQQLGAIAVESQSWPRNAGAVAKVAMAWGIVAALAEIEQVALVHRTPQEIKRYAAGRRDASKIEVLAGMCCRPGFSELERMLADAGCPVRRKPDGTPRDGKWEHPVDAAAAIYAALDTEIVRALRRST